MRWNQRLLISQLPQHLGEEVELKGWVQFSRKSSKIRFIGLRDGSATIQVVLVKGETPEEAFELWPDIRQEAAIAVRGVVTQSQQGPFGVELQARQIRLLGASVDYPITPKEHGPDFLLGLRHLWLRSKRQVSIFKIRDQVIRSIGAFFAESQFTKMDSPILTTAVGEDPSGLFALDYFDLGTAYLAQTGQLYLEASIFAHGRVFCFGPTFRAEKSKTRRHLAEFWMLEAEMAFFDSQDNIDLQEDLIRRVLREVLKHCRYHLEVLERNPAALERAAEEPFVRLDYGDAVRLLNKLGESISYGDDLGAPHETVLGEHFGLPCFVMDYPKAVKAFYMKEDPERPDRVKCADLIAPEGHGEIIGGSQREAELERLLQRIVEAGLPPENYDWYLDLRRYGSVEHAGFGIGLERLVGWIAGIHHIREAIPFPRLMERLKP
ncbi:MAG: asparagine--tRNA ligase [bacterium]|nr:asparagine--tRNA ligase [bacterium]